MDLIHWNFAIAHKDMDEDTAHRKTKPAMKNHARMMTFHAAAGIGWALLTSQRSG